MRKVKFTLEGHDLLGYAKPGTFDYDNDNDYKEAMERREGLFHCWGFELHPRTENGFPVSCGIVENIADGKIYLVSPENIQFINF